MWHLRRPTADDVGRFLEVQRGLAVNYQSGLLAGFQVDQARAELGRGEACFLAACAAIKDWRMFPSEWTGISPSRAPIEVNQVVAVLARVCGVWWLNCCRIVAVTDDHEPVRRFGF